MSEINTYLEAAIARFVDALDAWARTGDDRYMNHANERASLAFGIFFLGASQGSVRGA